MESIQGEVEMVKDTVEAVAEVVEEAATVAEKVSSEVAEQLPEGGRLRTAAVVVEHASKEVAQEAHLAQDIIHKVHMFACNLKQCKPRSITFTLKQPRNVTFDVCHKHAGPESNADSN